MSPFAKYLCSPAICPSARGPPTLSIWSEAALTIDLDFTEDQRAQFDALPPLPEIPVIHNGSSVTPNERRHDFYMQPLALGPNTNGRRMRQRLTGGSPMLRPPLSQFESLMKWAESRSVIVPPYLCSDFIAASVAPTKAMSQAKPSPDAFQCHADDSECSGDEQLDLSPLRPQDDDDFDRARQR